MKLPVTVRRFLGWTVPGPRPGFKRVTAEKAHAPVSSNGHAVITGNGGLSKLDSLLPGFGMLIPAAEWRAQWTNFNSAQASLRKEHPTARFTVRVARAKGGVPDMLVIRTA